MVTKLTSMIGLVSAELFKSAMDKIRIAMLIVYVRNGRGTRSKRLLGQSFWGVVFIKDTTENFIVSSLFYILLVFLFCFIESPSDMNVF